MMFLIKVPNYEGLEPSQKVSRLKAKIKNVELRRFKITRLKEDVKDK